MDLVFEVALGRLGGHVDAIAVDVEFPTMVDAANAALFIAPEVERRATVRAVRLQDADLATGVAKRDQVLAEQTQAHRRTIRLGQFLWQHRGQPEAAKQLAHGRSRTDTTREFIVFLA